MQRLEDDLLWSRDHVRRLEQLIESANELLSQDICELEAIFELKSQDGSLRNSFSESFDRKSSLKSDAWIASLRVSACFLHKIRVSYSFSVASSIASAHLMPG